MSDKLQSTINKINKLISELIEKINLEDLSLEFQFLKFDNHQSFAYYEIINKYTNIQIQINLNTEMIEIEKIHDIKEDRKTYAAILNHFIKENGRESFIFNNYGFNFKIKDSILIPFVEINHGKTNKFIYVLMHILFKEIYLIYNELNLFYLDKINSYDLITQSANYILRDYQFQKMKEMPPESVIANLLSINAKIFNQINDISSLMYEKSKINATLILDINSSISLDVKFNTNLPIHQSRLARKILQLSSDQLMVVCDQENILGLLNLSNFDKSKFIAIKFVDHYYWKAMLGDEIIFEVLHNKIQFSRKNYNEENLKQKLISFKPSIVTLIEDLFDIINFAFDENHGSILILVENATEELERLKNQSIKIENQKISKTLYRSFSKIDGAIILDFNLSCHGFGVILDGSIDKDCNPSRGSRYNSTLKYIKTIKTKAIAFVISDDKTIDIIDNFS